MPKIILASSSPRRKDLLTRMGVEFEAIASDIPEPLDQSRDPRENAKELSLAKARHIADQYPDAYVIGSDTIVAVDGVQMAKAESIEEARAMLLDLEQASVECRDGYCARQQVSKCRTRRCRSQ